MSFERFADLPMTFSPLSWDSNLLGVPSGLLEIVGTDDTELLAAVPDCLAEARSSGLKFLTAKIDARQQLLVNQLIQSGGMLVDTELTFHKIRHQVEEPSPFSDGFRIRKLESYWDDSLYALAGTLEHSRFFIEPKISNIVALKLWETSIYNSCNGRASYSIVCFDGDFPAGLINVFEKDGVSDIFLIAVLPEYQGKGLGRAMLDHYEFSLDAEITEQAVETQLINFPAQSLYTRMGYKNVFAKHTVHLWL